MQGTKFLAHLFYFLQKGSAMQDDLKQEQPVQQHPYQENQEKTVVCELGDAECAKRLVEAFADCD
mgnify:CR=1 FL=1